MRELRGEMERLRVEREEWQGEAGKERERRETMEEESRVLERRERDGRREWERGKEDMIQEKRRADNLQEVLSEFQSGEMLLSSSIALPVTTDFGQFPLGGLELTLIQLKRASCGRPPPSWTLNFVWRRRPCRNTSSERQMQKPE